MQALHDVVKAGYVRYLGMSSCYAYQCKYFSFIPAVRQLTLQIYRAVHQMQSTPSPPLPPHPTHPIPELLTTATTTDYAITHNLTPFISMQNHYNLVYREEEREMFPTLKLFGVGSIPWSPLARGLLTRPVDAESKRGSVDWCVPCPCSRCAAF